MKLRFKVWMGLGIVFGLSPLVVQAQQAEAKISGPGGISGTVTFAQQANGYVRISALIKGDPKVLTPGRHGLHLHEVGSCDLSTEVPFSSAKGHFDPGPFGSSTPVEANHPYHLGDLPNLEVNDRGEGHLETISNRISLSKGPVTLFDDNGSAVIVHKNSDEIKANGTAAEAGGARLACGVVKPS
ncbi:superoxide dismutase family protein [Anthocerotibacter panamensis]|uniref:superoxide dismutase family protein n=1 Tax=Anthocerotibacter panamensis TaxID=2857077 RepID=UPI001C403506|nr:superoxide dismutase family protein [Anthocerotibacter panamensis]